MTCGFPTKAGRPCPNAAELCAECHRCVSHCEHRVDLARERRVKGAKAAAKKRSATAQPIKVLTLAELPLGSLTTADDAIKLSEVVTFAMLTGELDHRVGQQVMRALEVFTRALDVRDHIAQLGSLKAQLRELKAAKGKP